MKRNFLLETAILSVCCANVNNAGVCDSCRADKGKKFIAKALGIKESDIWFTKEYKTKDLKNLQDMNLDKKGEDFEKRLENSHCVILCVLNFDNNGEQKEGEVNCFAAFIDNKKTINPSNELLEEIADLEHFGDINKGNEVKIMLVFSNNGGNLALQPKCYSCKKN